jgi:biopolymer transport protein ExbD
MKLRKLNKMSVHVGPNMTPMVDIVMCILIFFMLGTTFASPAFYLQNRTPAIDKSGLGQNADTLALPAVQNKIELRWIAGRTRVTGFDATIDGLGEAGAAALGKLLDAKQQMLSADVQILIAPDRAVPYQDVITVYDRCIAAHFKNVAFVAPR